MPRARRPRPARSLGDGEEPSGTDLGCARPSLLAALAVAAAAVAFWQLRVAGPVSLPQEVGFWNGDLYNIYYPGFAFAYRSAQFLPRWNPWQLAGAPFLAGYNGGFLYPPNWIATVIPVRLALGWVCAAHLAFAGITTLAAGRTLKMSWPAAFVASLTFMLSSRLASEATWPSYLAAQAWVPAVGLAAGLLVREPNAWRGAVLGAALALQFLTGIAQHPCYEGYVLAIAAAAAWIVRPRLDATWIRRVAVGLAVAGATAVGLAAVQLLPTLEVVAAAGRGGGLLLSQAGIPESPRAELWSIATSIGPAGGLAVLGLASTHSRRWVVAAAVVALVGILFAIGSPVFTWSFVTLPGVSLFRLPQRMLPIATFPLALLAGRGLDVARRRLDRAFTPRRVLAAVLAIAAGAVALPAAPHRWLSAAVLTGIVAIVIAPSRRLGTAAAWALVALTAVDRSMATRNTVMLTQNDDEAFFAPPPFVEMLRREAGDDRVILLKDWKRRFPFMEKAGQLWGLHVAQDYEPLVADAYHAFYGPIGGVPGQLQLFTGRVQVAPYDPGWRMLDLLAVRWVAVPPAVPWQPMTDRFRRTYVGPDATIWENLRAMPRTYVGRAVRVVPDREAALRAVTARAFDPHAEVVVEQGASPEPGGGGPSTGEVHILAESNDEVTLGVDTPTGGLVVLADLHWSGWQATVDGVATPILRANYLFRAVRVDPGTHEVRFRYAATRLRAGMVVSAFTLCALGVLWRRQRARTAPRSAPSGIVLG